MNELGPCRGILVVLSGPSGAGKNTLLRAARQRRPDLVYSVSATTRPPRPGEEEGVDYFFLSEVEFDRAVENNEFLEWARFCGYRYGTKRDFIDNELSQGRTVVMDIDIQGARQIREKVAEAVTVFLLPPGLGELRRRLEGRGSDSKQVIETRLQAVQGELQAMRDYEYFVLNKNLEEAVDQFLAIISAEERKLERYCHQSIIEWVMRR